MQTSIYKLDVFHTDGIVSPDLGKIAVTQVKSYKIWGAAARWAKQNPDAQVWLRLTVLNAAGLPWVVRWYGWDRSVQYYFVSKYTNAEFEAEFCVLDGLGSASKRKGKADVQL